MFVPGLSADYCSLAPCVKNISTIADDALKLHFFVMGLQRSITRVVFMNPLLLPTNSIGLESL